MLPKLEEFCYRLQLDTKGLMHCPWSKGHAKYIYYHMSQQIRYEHHVDQAAVRIECGDCGGIGETGSQYSDEPPYPCGACNTTGQLIPERVRKELFRWRR